MFATTMFVRFRHSASRLQLSLIETRRVASKVRHDHVASLGAIPWPPTVADRIAFWLRLHERLAKLSNRVDAENQTKILGSVHARIPMVTTDEQRALQLDNAKADADFWETFSDINGEMAEGKKQLAKNAERGTAEAEAAKRNAAEHAEAAKERIARIERGETVSGGLGKPITGEDIKRMLKDRGWTDADIRHCVRLAQLDKTDFEAFVSEVNKRQTSENLDRAALRAVLRRKSA